MILLAIGSVLLFKLIERKVNLYCQLVECLYNEIVFNIQKAVIFYKFIADKNSIKSISKYELILLEVVEIEINFKDKLVNNMVGNLDFHEINPKIDEVINSLDKTYIDDVLKERATIENIAIYIIKRLKEFNNLYSVVVYEGRDKYIEILKEEIE